ncbi:MAG: hypothetical protein HQL52_10950 [Magnetococcales bacterium]|nr:hypothetical protein [Magnetococcales bacterium]
MEIIPSSSPLFAKHFARLWRLTAWRHPLYQPRSIRYAQAYTQIEKARNLSFVVCEGGVPLAGVLWFALTREGERELSVFGWPVLYLENQQLDPTLKRSLGIQVKEQVQQTLGMESPALAPAKLLYMDPLLQGRLSFFGEMLLSIGARAQPRVITVVDLFQSEEALWQGVRKSYKSLINWGEKHLEPQIVSGREMTGEKMEAFRQNHIQQAGRETRSPQTWALQRQMVEAGEGFCVYGHWQGELVSSSLFLHSDHYTLYGVSASERKLFDKPLAHSLIWKAMVHAKSLGHRYFEMGDRLYPELGATGPVPSENRSEPTPKEMGISRFKGGFGGEEWVHLELYL